MLDVILYIWIASAVASAAYVAWDAFTKNPEIAGDEVGLAAGTALAGRYGDFSMTAETMTCENGRFE